MTGILPSGAAVTVRRPDTPAHPLTHATEAEARSTFIHLLIDAGHPWSFIKTVMRCGRETARTDAKAPAIPLYQPPRSTHAGCR